MNEPIKYADPILDHAVGLVHAILRDRGPAITPDAIPALLKQMYDAVRGAGTGESVPPVTGGRQVTLDEAKASITDSHLISFEDNKPYKSLTRHLKAHGLTFEQYKAKWGLPSQYPAIHPSYSIKRRDLALAAGLGKGAKVKK